MPKDIRLYFSRNGVLYKPEFPSDLLDPFQRDFHFLYSMIQRLYLSIQFANESVTSKEMVESLAFAMMVNYL